MQRTDRVELPHTLFRDMSRRFLGTVLGFDRDDVFVLLDQPVQEQHVVRVPATMPVPVTMRHVEGKGWIEIDVRHLCTSAACMFPPSHMLIFEGQRKDAYALYCDECTEQLRESALFLSATPLSAIEKLEV